MQRRGRKKKWSHSRNVMGGLVKDMTNEALPTFEKWVGKHGSLKKWSLVGQRWVGS